MKIRRIILLVLLAAGSVFLLTSCDALLDAIFSNNTITVYISAYIPAYCSIVGIGPTYYLSYGTDTMTVASLSGPTGFNGTANYDGNDGSYMYWSLEVPKLADGTYSVSVHYYHPFGVGPVNQTLVQNGVSLPSGSNHSVNLFFNF